MLGIEKDEGLHIDWALLYWWQHNFETRHLTCRMWYFLYAAQAVLLSQREP
jgi:hypothetical protein